MTVGRELVYYQLWLIDWCCALPTGRQFIRPNEEAILFPSKGFNHIWVLNTTSSSRYMLYDCFVKCLFYRSLSLPLNVYKHSEERLINYVHPQPSRPTANKKNAKAEKKKEKKKRRRTRGKNKKNKPSYHNYLKQSLLLGQVKRIYGQVWFSDGDYRCTVAD